MNLFIAHVGCVVYPDVDAPVASIHSDTISQFKEHENKLAVFDYDGTLAPFVDDPEDAIPSEALSEALAELNDDPTAHPAIISGRDQPFLDKHFAKYRNFYLSAEYGAARREPGGQWVQAEGLKLDWKPLVISLMKQEHDKYQGPLHELLRIEPKITGVVLHYRKLNNHAEGSKELAKSLKYDARKKRITILDPFFEELKAMNTAGKLGSNELKVENDNLAIEVRMGQVLSKGMVVKELLKSNPRTRMAVCFGDSNADEDMIKTLKSSGLPVVATFHVKNNKYLETKAMHKMETPQQAVDLLRAFYDMEPKKIELKKEN